MKPTDILTGWSAYNTMLLTNWSATRKGVKHLPLQLYEREKILEACLSVFARYGYKNTSTEMLAEAAGISKALIFHHFISKKKLYLSLLEHCFEKVRTVVRFDVFSEQEDFFNTIDRLSRIKLAYFRKHPDELKLVHEAFYSPPNELKADIEEKYGQAIAERNQSMERLFEAVPLREGVDRKQAFELIMITTKHFENKFSAAFTDTGALDDEAANGLFDEMNRFYSMIRHGIAE
ncbi:TetR/AcrR family transcriptional regulator [Paenibacillus ehimensis]|uniref:TetR/AcrR family transcriptional regulator n=1 Tax=Paenibacillus ehimensis TaxID=79264 RepID=UPI002DBB6C23|nr:TetR/AcrR family transcriptional regulator [Paenibacillus ehimensis]MEC0207879.1 TetR/AcrR family transcriptional regulator [Paenibacillus ehimensis]